MAAGFYGHPSRSLQVIGITGTNGKTTTAHLVASILDRAAIPCGVIGTLSGTHTTPDGPTLQRQLGAFVADGRQAVAMEVSSHALDQRRVAGTQFGAAVFTNLTQDHLDYHGTMEAYFQAKALLFTPEYATVGVVNGDDIWGRRLADTAGIPVVAYSRADAEDLVLRPGGSSFLWRGAAVHTRLAGGFNVSNALAAATTCAAIGVPVEAIVEGLAAVGGVPGRVESVDAGQNFTVVVDYAHTPDGLEQVLSSMRDLLAPGAALSVVFGCGGDRDRAKRPLMGEVAARIADRVVVTSDNPRSEDPTAIVEAVLAGIEGAARERVAVEVDREAAIEHVLRSAEAGDIVVIAGKGHETGQTVSGATRPFDDRDVARRILGSLRGAR
jgi:UDP-N-acetylmuramoyl-L-alanyl-D-glutamate--2,6-diaminopimelate ligase